MGHVIIYSDTSVVLYKKLCVLSLDCDIDIVEFAVYKCSIFDLKFKTFLFEDLCVQLLSGNMPIAVEIFFLLSFVVSIFSPHYMFGHYMWEICKPATGSFHIK